MLKPGWFGTYWDSLSSSSGLCHCLLDFSRLLPTALPPFGPLLREDCYQTQLLPSALFLTLQRFPWPPGSSLNPRAWPPEPLLHWFLPSLKVSLPITFTPHQIQPPFPTRKCPLLFWAFAHGGLLSAYACLACPTHASSCCENVTV